MLVESGEARGESPSTNFLVPTPEGVTGEWPLEAVVGAEVSEGGAKIFPTTRVGERREGNPWDKGKEGDESVLGEGRRGERGERGDEEGRVEGGGQVEWREGRMDERGEVTVSVTVSVPVTVSVTVSVTVTATVTVSVPVTVALTVAVTSVGDEEDDDDDDANDDDDADDDDDEEDDDDEGDDENDDDED